MANEPQGEQKANPWDTYDDAKVTDSAPAEEVRTNPTKDGEPKIIESAAPAGSPADRYVGYEVVESMDAFEGNVADATSEALTAAAIEAAPKNAEERSTGAAVMDWFGDVGRGTILGPISDPISALILSKMHEDQGITYKQALSVVQANNEASKSTTAGLLGAILGGGIVASGLKKAATYGVAKSGLARGAMQMASKDKILNRVVSAAATGAAAGAVEEGVRTSLEELVDVSGGHEFDGARVADSVIFGALIGGAATPILQEGMNGAKWMFHHIKKTSGNPDAQAYEATKRILREFADGDETLDQASDRFRQKVQDFTKRHGRTPAAAEILKPEQVKGVAEIARSYNGLDIRARELGEKGVRRALRDYDMKVTNGDVIASPEMIKSQIEEVFTDVVSREGKTMVDVPDDAMVYLQRNLGFINGIAPDNEGAAAMARVLNGKAQVAGMRKQHQKILDSKNNGDARLEVNRMKEKLAHMIEDMSKEGDVPASEFHELKILIQLKDAIAKRAASERNSVAASFNLEEFKPQLDHVMRELDRYDADGLKVSLSDINQIRHTASRHFSKLSASGDPAAADSARRVRDVIAPIGTKEVPEYGQVVKRFNLEMNRAESQVTGAQIARGDVDLQDINVRLSKGNVPNRPKSSNPDQIKAIQQGAAEGARRELATEVTGNTGGRGIKPADGVRGAQRVASDPQVQGGLKQALGSKDAKAITRAAKQVSATYDRMKELSRPTSVSEMAAERQVATEIATGTAFGNLGGAGKAALLTRMFNHVAMPRGTAKKVIEMLGNPKEMDQALKFAQKKGVRVGPLFAAIQQHLIEPVSNE